MHTHQQSEALLLIMRSIEAQLTRIADAMEVQNTNSNNSNYRADGLKLNQKSEESSSK